MDGHLVLTKVVPHCASGMESYACLISLTAVYSRDEPLCIFCAASLIGDNILTEVSQDNSGCSVLLPG